MNGLIFDCDGVLADTERYGHLPAFNRMFRELGVPVQWSEEEYGRKLEIGGGKERMRSLFTDDFVREAGLPTDPDQQTALIGQWHARKTEIYTAMVEAGDIPPRPGVARLAGAAADAGWRLAVASTSARASVAAVLVHAVGTDLAARFAVFAGDIVPHKKPAPDIYWVALEECGLDARVSVAIEDSRNGLLAARAAGMPCLVTVNDYTRDQDMSEAAVVVSDLGEPGGEPITVLENRTDSEIGSYITLSDVQACLQSPAAAAR